MGKSGLALVFLLVFGFLALVSSRASSQVYARPYYYRNDFLFLQDNQPLPPPAEPKPASCDQCSEVGQTYSHQMKTSYVNYSEQYNDSQNVEKKFNANPFDSQE